jgi:hypothetical protein
MNIDITELFSYFTEKLILNMCSHYSLFNDTRPAMNYITYLLIKTIHLSPGLTKWTPITRSRHTTATVQYTAKR